MYNYFDLKSNYLKIYPKRITATYAEDNIFKGEFRLLVEQYGLDVFGKSCQVKIFKDNENWQISVEPISRVETNQFQRFVESLNHYLFSVLKSMPSDRGSESPVYEVFLDDVYFSMSGENTFVKKILNWNKTNKSSQLDKGPTGTQVVGAVVACMGVASIALKLSGD